MAWWMNVFLSMNEDVNEYVCFPRAVILGARIGELVARFCLASVPQTL